LNPMAGTPAGPKSSDAEIGAAPPRPQRQRTVGASSVEVPDKKRLREAAPAVPRQAARTEMHF
jgi:hypothetical protein